MNYNNTVSVKKAAIINAIAKYISVIIQILFTAILSRILTPEDYGIITVVNVIIVLFQLLADMGFGSGVIQFKELTQKEIYDIFSFTIYIGLALIPIFICTSFFVSIYFSEEIYRKLGIIASITVCFLSFNMIPNAVMLKNKRFVEIGIRTVVVSLVSLLVTLFLALLGSGVYALVFYSLLNAVLLFIWNESKIQLRFVLLPSKQSIEKIWGYSIYQFGTQILNYFSRNVDNFMIGKLIGSTALGYYNKSYALMQYPITYIPGVINPVLHPILSDYQNNKDYIYDIYLRLLKFLSLIGCFCSIFCSYAAKEIILILFGNQWKAAILPFSILSLSLNTQLLTNTVGSIYQSIGNTRLLFKSLICSCAMVITMIVLGVSRGTIVYVALFVCVAYILNFFVLFLPLVKKGFNKRFVDFLLFFKEDFAINAVLLVLSRIIRINLDNILLAFLTKLALIGAIYIVLVYVTRQYKYITQLFN